MKYYETMKLVIVLCEARDIITASGDNEKLTDVSDFFKGFYG